MAHYNQDWEELGRNIQDIVDRAVNSQDYQKLNQTIRQVVDQAVDKGGQAVRRAVEKTEIPTRRITVYREANRPAVQEKKNLPVLYRNTNGRMVKGILKIVGGSILTALSLMIFFSSLVFDALAAGAVSMSVPITLTIAGFAGGGLLIGSGTGNTKQIRRFRTYQKTLGEHTYCTLEKLARAVGKGVKFVRRDLQKMINQGYFLQGHLDKEGTTLIISDETYEHYRQSLLQYEQRKQLEAAAQQKKQESGHTPEVRSVLDRGGAFIAQIRKCNDDIPGREISDKISHMELIVRRIFQRVDTNPEVVPDLKKMMDYYLPMTVKLLKAYAEMDAQPVQGENIKASKKEIEDTLDTLNLAFEKLLDELFEDTALDVSSDISVLQTLLAQEGLTEDDLSKMKKNH